MAAVEQEPLDHDSLLKLLEERGALLQGHFLLSSGLHSPRYLQCARVLMDPALATRLGRALAERLRPLVGADAPRAVVAPALGGVLVAHEVARGLSCPGLFTERQDGKMALRRGFTLEPGDAVVVVEDVITTGGSTREVMGVVESSGARVRWAASSTAAAARPSSAWRTAACSSSRSRATRPRPVRCAPRAAPP